MKTLKEFILNKQQNLPEKVEVFVSNEPEILELTEEPTYNVGTELPKESHREPMDPPAILVMRRKSIRQFSNKQRVALYFVDKINKYITIPYNPSQWSLSIPEEFKQE